MPTRKKKIFAEDMSVFETDQFKPEADIRSYAPKKKLSNKRADSKELEAALLTLKRLGIKVTFPSTEEDTEKQAASADKLGIQKQAKVIPPVEPEKLRVVLGIAHCIGEQVYGPGEVILPVAETNLYRELIHRDRLSRQAYCDTKEYNPTSRHYVIQVGATGDGNNKFKKVEVSERDFNSERVWDTPGITAGATDIAGYSANNFKPDGEF